MKIPVPQDISEKLDTNFSLIFFIKLEKLVSLAN